MKHLFVAEDGTETIVDYTEEEIKAVENNKKADAIELTQQLAEAQAKAASRQAVLDRLGLTAEEAQLLLGGN